VTAFYVSNREAYHETATRSNLTRHGFPLDAAEDVVLLRGEQAGWGGDKSSRRAHVAARFRVLLLVGDDLGDFLGVVRTDVARREALAAPYSEYWGFKWFLLPNPSYGSWEEALYADPKPADPGEQLKQKLGHLKTGR
jgi:acid phosphatase